MNSREIVLGRVRDNQPAPRALPAMPEPGPLPAAPWEAFAAALARMGGVVTEPPPPGQPLAAFVAARFAAARVVVSATPECRGTREIDVDTDPATLEDVDVGVVRGAFGVAETGSVYLDDRGFVVGALGFLSQHLVVLLDPASIVGDLHAAYGRPGFFDRRYAVLMTGPSATADIEGVLIRGAQGIRSFTVVPLAAPATSATSAMAVASVTAVAAAASVALVASAAAVTPVTPMTAVTPVTPMTAVTPVTPMTAVMPQTPVTPKTPAGDRPRAAGPPHRRR